MTEKCLSNAKKAKADVLVTPCTLCHLSLDCYQKPANTSNRSEIPVLHLAQLLGLAVGIRPEELGLRMNMVRVGKHIRKNTEATRKFHKK
jgi:succinate dehydrogenase / fumarate reductase cytochrome b subunit